MAYIECKKCGTRMSDKSEACPVCGTPVNNGTLPELSSELLAQEKQTVSKQYAERNGVDKLSKKARIIISCSIALVVVAVLTVLILNYLFKNYGYDKSIYEPLWQYNVEKLAQEHNRPNCDFESFYKMVRKQTLVAEHAKNKYKKITYKRLYHYVNEIKNPFFLESAKKRAEESFIDTYKTPLQAKISEQREKWIQYIINHTISNYIEIQPIYDYETEGFFFLDYRPKYYFEVIEFKEPLTNVTANIMFINDEHGKSLMDKQTWNLSQLMDCNGERGHFNYYSNIDDRHYWESHHIEIEITSITTSEETIYWDDLTRMPKDVTDYLSNPNFQTETEFIRKFVDSKYPSMAEHEKYVEKQIQLEKEEKDKICYQFLTES